VPDGTASLLLRMRHKRSIHLRVVIDAEALLVIVKLLLVMVVRLLWHHVMLLVRHMDRLGLVVAIEVISIRWRVLRMRHKLVVLVERRKFHRRLAWRYATSERWWVSEGQWGRFWTFTLEFLNPFTFTKQKNKPKTNKRKRGL
jgi:hypothetical protein